MVCFGFVTRTAFIAHQCFGFAEQHLHSGEFFSFSHSAPPVSRLEVSKKLGGGVAGTADPGLFHTIQCHMLQ